MENPAFWTIAPGGIYFVPADAPKSLCFFDFYTKHENRQPPCEKAP